MKFTLQALVEDWHVLVSISVISSGILVLSQKVIIHKT